MRNGRYSIGILIASILCGAVYAIPAEFLYRILRRLSIPRPLVTGCYFGGLFLVIGIVLYIAGSAVEHVKNRKINMKMWGISFAAILVCSLFFEFVYDLIVNVRKPQEIDSYVFLIDNSSSMNQTDPDGLRYQAVEKLLEGKDDAFPYAVYLFDTYVECARPMSPKSEESIYDDRAVDGNTEIAATFERIYSDLENGSLDAGENCRIILITDGYATDIWFFNKGSFIRGLSALDDYDISVSTVGLLEADKQLLTDIAEKTDGVFVNVMNVSDLEAALQSAAAVNQSNTRDLLGYRSSRSLNILLGMMRIVFIALLGMIIGVQKTVVCDKFLNTNSVVYGSLISSAIAGIFIEIGMNMLGLNEMLTRMITCALITLTVLQIDPGMLNNSGRQVMSYDE